MDIERIAQKYKIDQFGIDVVKKSKTVFIVGIVAAGKDTIIKRLLKKPDYHLIISHTTRRPRSNDGLMEVDGVDYYFVSFDTMAQLMADHKMVEVNKFGENYYGTSVSEIEDANKNNKIAISDIDIHGIKSFNDIAPNNIIAIFILPPDYETWVSRLRNRYKDADDVFNNSWQTRRSITINELEHALGSSKYHFVINDDLDQAVIEVDRISHGLFDKSGYDRAREKASEILQHIKQNP